MCKGALDGMALMVMDVGLVVGSSCETAGRVVSMCGCSGQVGLGSVGSSGSGGVGYCWVGMQ